MTKSKVESWKILGTTYNYRDQWVRLRSDDVLLPDGSKLNSYHTLEIPDGVNILAISDTHEAILIEQYRLSVGDVLFELPAGHINPLEDSEAAAKRELSEETGYGGGAWHYLGQTYTMASRLSNRIHNFLAVGVSKMHQPRFDSAEFIRSHCVRWADVLATLGSQEPIIREANQLSTILLAKQFVVENPSLQIVL